MEFQRHDAPFLTPRVDVASIMRQVLYALIPALAAHGAEILVADYETEGRWAVEATKFPRPINQGSVK